MVYTVELTTPTKEQIRERAIELFNNSNSHLPSITPEDNELKESGLWFEARDDLTQRPQSISTEALERVESYLFGKLVGDRNLTKVRRIAGKKIANRLKTLKQGEYVYFDGDKSQKVIFQEFKPTSKPQRIELKC